jgi:uncharacterized alkaline shock family protein YloU
MDAAANEAGYSEESKGRVVIAPEVLMTIARLAALSVPGVIGMAAVPGGVNRLFRRQPQHSGVRIAVHDDTVRADLYLVVGRGTNLRDVGQRVQAEVARAIDQMLGMHVASVNIHIEDVAYSDAGD